MTVTLNASSSELLITVFIFLKFCFVVSIETASSVFSSASYFLCLFEYVLSKSVISPVLEGGFIKEIYSVNQKCSPTWHPEAGAQRVSSMWAVYTLQL